MKLETLAPNKGARKRSHRVGRGNAAGSGRTAGKGEKGQKARSGGRTRPGFEGGQMPLYRRLPKFGFRTGKQILGLNNFQVVNLSVLEQSFDNGAVVTVDSLKEMGWLPNAKQKGGIKILAKGNLTKKLTVKVNAISAEAKAKIESLGGSVELVKQ